MLKGPRQGHVPGDGSCLTAWCVTVLVNAGGPKPRPRLRKFDKGHGLCAGRKSCARKKGTEKVYCIGRFLGNCSARGFAGSSIIFVEGEIVLEGEKQNQIIQVLVRCWGVALLGVWFFDFCQRAGGWSHPPGDPYIGWGPNSACSGMVGRLVVRPFFGLIYLCSSFSPKRKGLEGPGCCV